MDMGGSGLRDPLEPWEQTIENSLASSAICVAPMLDSSDVQSVTVILEAEPVIADAQPKLGRLNTLKALHIALAVAAK